jgi:tripartite-type tricarboxylate transporter receptor subunit TctC
MPPRKRLARQLGAISAAMLAVAMCGSMPKASAAGAEPDFYAGKTITIIVGYGPGTGYDIYTRLFARHLPNHLKGHPNVVTQNMPGAGSFTAAGYLYNSAAKDGTVLGMIDQASPLSQTLGVSGFRADVSKFNWIGRLTSNAAVLFARANAGITDMRQTFKQDLIISAPGQNSRIMSSVMKNLLGLKLKIVTGYHSSAESSLALERGEVQAMTLPWSVLRSERPKWLEEHFVNLLLQMGTESHPELKSVPLVTSLASNAEDEKVLSLVSNDSRVGRSILAPPGLPPERVAELRKAFSETLADPVLLAEAKQGGIDVFPMSGDDLQTMISTSVMVDPAAVERVKSFINTKQ